MISPSFWLWFPIADSLCDIGIDAGFDKSGTVSFPQTFRLAAFVHIAGKIAICILFIPLNGPDNFYLFHGCRFDASFFCDFSEFLHFHDSFLSLE